MRFASKLGYGVGQFSDGVKQAAFNTFLFFYYNQVLGLSASLAGMAALLALIVDAITDPMVGQLSDRLQSKWGRRHPFMLAAILPFGLTMLALFNPPDALSQFQLFAWMAVSAILVRLSLTLFFVPHLSLGAELIDDYHARTSLIGFRVFFTYAGVLIVSVTGFAAFFPSTEQFSNGLLNREAYPSFGIMCAILGSLAMLLCVVVTWHYIPQLRAPSVQPETKSPPAIWAIVDVLRTLKLQSFRVLFSVNILFNMLSGVIMTLLVYVATFVFDFDPDQLAGLAMSVIIGVLFASLVAQYLARRFDKKAALAWSIVIASLFAFTPLCLFLVGVVQALSAVQKFALVFMCNGLSQVFFIAYVILLDSMLTDIVDEHELVSGRREEGLFFAARAFATKASFGLGSFVSGVGLDIIRFPTDATPETVPPEAVSSLAILAGPVLMLAFIATIGLSNRYPLNRARHALIRQQLPR